VPSRDHGHFIDGSLSLDSCRARRTKARAGVGQFRTFAALLGGSRGDARLRGSRCYVSHPCLCMCASVRSSPAAKFDLHLQQGSSAFTAGQVKRHTRPEGA
jgi:hypothetical protein